MAEYIDRQQLIDALNTWPKYGVDERVRIVGWNEGLEPYVHFRDIVTAIANIPAADVVERKKGRWILRLPANQDNNATWECSVCHAGEVHVPIVEVPFCWKCGADMRGEQDEAD